MKSVLATPCLFRYGVSAALLFLGLFGMTSQAAADKLSTVEAVTYDGAQVTPDEVTIDLRHLPMGYSRQTLAERPYRPLLRPAVSPKMAPRTAASEAALSGGRPLAPMPSANNFAGMSRTDSCTGGNCGSGWPPDPNGDVGPNHYIEAVNTAYAIYNKTGTRLAAFTEDQLWSGVGTTPCNGNSQGDPIVLYDALADRWILSHFAFGVDGSGNPVSPFYQCIAASKSSDPVAGGWWLYALRMDPGTTGAPPVGALNDYGKFGIWNDCLYMAANEFAMPTGSFKGTAFASFNRSDLYSGAALTWSLGFINNTSNPFTMIPSNLSGKAASSLPAGTPNYFVSESGIAWAFEVRKFTPGTNCGGGGSLSTATNVSQTSYNAIGTNNVPQPNTSNKLDNVDDRLMQKVQYRKVGTQESLWVVHNVQTAGGVVTPQWAQIDVTGGTIATTPVQQQIYAPDSTLFRWMGSLAVDSQGNMALGYSTSNGTSPNFPSIAYSGRLASDPLNTLPQTEVTLFAGAGSQTNNCGGAACNRWGDYTSMSVDPADDCTFWYTNQYYSSQPNGNSGNWQTRVGSFKFASCAAAATSHLINFSTRGQVQTGNNVMIGGFIIQGSTPKKVLIRAVGPTLANYGVAGVLADPMLELHRSSDGAIIASNDDWGSASNAAEITATTLAPVNSKESAILIALDPGAYTAIVTGKNAGTGVGIVEVYEIDHPEIPLINISTRGRVEIGDSVMIGGFIIQGSTNQTVLIRAVGPNLLNYGVTGVLANPKLDLYSGQTNIANNDNWQTATNAAAIQATGLAPVSPLESAILISLPPGAYTAIVSGSDGGSGVGIVEVFAQ